MLLCGMLTIWTMHSAPAGPVNAYRNTPVTSKSLLQPRPVPRLHTMHSCWGLPLVECSSALQCSPPGSYSDSITLCTAA